MDVEVKPERIDIDKDSNEEIEPIIGKHTKQENELIIDSDWLPTPIQGDENECYQDFMKESNKNNESEIFAVTDGGCVKYVIENVDESDDSEEDDYAESDDMCVEKDSSERDYFCSTGQESQEAEDKEDAHQVALNKWIVENYINRECSVCKEHMSNDQELQRHVTELHKQSIEEYESNYYFCSDIYNCKICNYKSKRSCVENHILNMHPETVQDFKPSNYIDNLRCPLCSNTYLKHFQLCYHFMDKHPHEYKSRLHFNCTLCKVGHYDDKEVFLKHLIEQHFLNSWEILNYRKVFEDKEYFACTNCNRLLFQNDICKLLSHFLKHNNNFYWSCQFCNKDISFKTSPLSHMCFQIMRYYEKAKVASKEARKTRAKIKNLQEFEEHIVHVCPFCDKNFNKMLKWHHHMRTDHAIDTLKGLQLKIDDNDDNKLRCLICFTLVKNSPEQIHAHSFQHLPYKPYKCVICLKMLDTYKMAFDHVINRCRDEDPPYDVHSSLKIQCLFCNFQEMDDLKSVLKHYENEHNYFENFFLQKSDNSITCKICQKKYIQYEKMSCFQHLHNHFEEKTFKCKLCLQSYPSFRRFSEHLSQFHNAKPLNKDRTIKSNDHNLANAKEFQKFISFVCPECNESMKTKHTWLTHIRTHHNFFDESNLYNKMADGSLKCPTCNITLDTNAFRQRKHKLFHMPHKSFMCNFCYERSISLHGIHLHFRRKHFAWGTFQCPICRAILLTEHQRTEHIKRSHSSEELPEALCLICYKILPSKLSLNKHMDTHDADRFIYTCELCSIKTFRLRDFIAHRDEHKMIDEYKLYGPNVINIIPETVIKKWNVLSEFEEFIFYVCPECNEGMLTQENWHSHVRTQHNFFSESNLYVKEADGSLKCPTCGIWLSTRPCQQQRHKLTHMPYKSFMCNLCNDRSSFLDGIYAHFRRKHFTQGAFECPICTDVLQTENERTEHIKKSHSRKEWPQSICLICYKMFTSSRVLNHHMVNHKVNRFKYNCDICGSQEFFKLNNLKLHLDGHKKRSEFKEKLALDTTIQLASTSSQPICNRDIEIGVELANENINKKINKSHVFNEFEGSLSCEVKHEICDDISLECSSANSPSNDNDGMETERRRFRFRATSSCASPNSQSNDGYENVSETATDEINKNKRSYERQLLVKYMSFACPECNKGVSTQEDWHNHIKTQHNIFDESNLYVSDANGCLKCPTCRITVDTRAYQQQRHKLTHLKYKSFICNLCYERYSSLDGIRAHFRRKHFVEGTFECPICLQVLQTLHQRTEHLKNVHPRKEWPDKMCTICYKIFSTKSRLNHHMITHNANRFKYTCDVCGVRICNAKTFRLHVQKHKTRGETSENWSDSKCSQFRIRKIQSKETGVDVDFESENVDNRTSPTNSSKTENPQIVSE